MIIVKVRLIRFAHGGDLQLTVSDTIGNAPVVKQGRFPEKVFLLLMGCSKNYNVLGFTSIIIPRVSADVCTNITKSSISFCAV